MSGNTSMYGIGDSMIYFDNAATTQQKPECVIQAVTKALCNFGNSGRSVHEGALSASRVVYEARVEIAEFFCSKKYCYRSNRTKSACFDS